MGSSSCLRKLDISWLEDVERAMSIAHSTSSPFLYSTGYQSVYSLTEAMAMLVLTGDICRDMQYSLSEHLIMPLLDSPIFLFFFEGQKRARQEPQSQQQQSK